MLRITMITENFDKKQGFKNAYKLIETEKREISEQQYRNICESAPFFRRLGGSVTQQKSYTCYGYKVVRDIATSLNKETKTIRKFNFEYLG